MQKKVPCIWPVGVADAGPARVLEMLARLEQRLVADDGQTTHVLALAVGVGHHPVAGDQLGGDVAAVANADGVGEGVGPFGRLRLLGQVLHMRLAGELGLGHAGAF